MIVHRFPRRARSPSPSPRLARPLRRWRASPAPTSRCARSCRSGAGSGVDTIMRAVQPVADQGARRPAGRDREPARRRRHHRHAGDRQGARPTASTIGVVSNNHVINPSVYKKMPFDSHQRHHADHGRRHDAAGAGRQPDQAAGEERQGTAVAASRPSRAPTTTRRRATARSSTWPPRCSSTRPASTSKHIPYKGVGPMVTDIIGGQVDWGVSRCRRCRAT